MVAYNKSGGRSGRFHLYINHCLSVLVSHKGADLGLASSKTLGPVNGKTRTTSSLSKKLPTLQKLSTTYVDTPFLKSISTSVQTAHSDVKTHQTEDPVSTSKEIVSHTNSAIKPSSRVAPVIPTSNKEVPSSVSLSSGTKYIVNTRTTTKHQTRVQKVNWFKLYEFVY